MPEVLRELRRDHVNVAMLLDLMQVELDALREGRRPDSSLLLDIMQYMRHYPDRFHHPREELVFAKLIRRDRGARPLIELLQGQHKECAALGSTLLRILKSGPPGTPDVESLEEPCKRYVDLLVGHMNEEESTVFPLARALLTRSDWTEIDTSLQCDVDPLFATDLQVAYRSIASALSRRQRP